MLSKKENPRSESTDHSKNVLDSSNLLEHGQSRVFMVVPYLLLGVLDSSCFGIGRLEMWLGGLRLMLLMLLGVVVET